MKHKKNGEEPYNSSPIVPELLPYPKLISVVSDTERKLRIDNRVSLYKYCINLCKTTQSIQIFWAIINIPLTLHRLSVPSLIIILFSSR